MGDVIGQLLPLAAGVAISPVPITVVILLLLAPHARVTGPVFLAGWVAGVLIATTVLVLIAAGVGMNAAPGEPKTAVSWFKLLLGVLMLTLAVRQITARPGPDDEAELPRWMTAVHGFTPAKAASFGLLLSAVYPKNLMMCAAAGIAIGEGEFGAGGKVVAVAVFTVIAACSVAVPVIAYCAAADRMRAPLDALKIWLERNNTTVMFVLLLVIGVVLIGRGLGGLID